MVHPGPDVTGAATGSNNYKVNKIIKVNYKNTRQTKPRHNKLHVNKQINRFLCGIRADVDMQANSFLLVTDGSDLLEGKQTAWSIQT